MKVNNIGIAAHIHAASPGGPRYDVSMSSTQRGAISNAIWLCSNCSIIIDRDEERYTPELLKEWKRKAEETAIKEQGKRLPSEEDAVNLMSMALTGHPKKFLPTAISNVHKATAKVIEETDPRFEVITHFKDGQTVFEYRAKEDVSFDFEVKGEEGVEILRKMFEEGHDAKLPAESFDIKGMDFPGGSIKEASHLEIKKSGLEAIQKIWTVNPQNNVINQFDDVHGLVYLGTKAMRFEGSACSGLFSINYTRSIVSKDESSNFNISVNFPEWYGRDIKRLPHFSKIKSLFESLVEGCEFHSSLEVYGESAFKACTKSLGEWPEMMDIYGILLYVDNARVIAEKLNIDLEFRNDFYYTAEEAIEVDEVAKTFKGEMTFSKEEVKNNAKFNLILDCDGDEFKEKINLEKVSSLRLTEEGQILEIFGQKVSLPDKHTYIKSVYINPLDDLGCAVKGDEVSFECLPAEKFEIHYTYVLEE
ncbi:MAG: hypothetical protein ACQEUM_04675 [Pseudomonadota bacterium]